MILYYFKIGSIMSQYVNSQNIQGVNWEASKRDNLSVGFDFLLPGNIFLKKYL